MPWVREDPPNFTEGISVELTRNGLWVEARRQHGGHDRYCIPANRLRRLATGTWKEDV
jgi:hypothetical protein